MTEAQDRVSIVTGAGTGIGQAIAIGLAEAGLRCWIVGRRPGPLEDTKARARDGYVFPIAADITREEDRERIVAEVVRVHGRIDVLVNNAGVSAIGPLLDADEAGWRRVMATNLDAAFFLAQRVMPLMRDRGWGRIVNVGSIYGALALNPALYEAFPRDGARGPVRQPGYHASKGALLNLTRDLAAAVATWGITVNTVSPGMIVTDQSRDLLSDEVKRRLCAMTPLGRFGEPDEIAHAVCFLASDKAAFITGEELRVDGGWSVW